MILKDLMAATAIAAVIVWRTRKPIAGLVAAAWLALGPFAMSREFPSRAWVR